MRLLYEIDLHDYDPEAPVFERPSARAIIVKDGLYAMIYSQTEDYYKFPGGGIEPGESHQAALCRETEEEAGLVVRPETIRPYGMVHRIQRGMYGDTFVQDNFYYFCDVLPDPVPQRLQADEARQRFIPVWVTPDQVIQANRRPQPTLAAVHRVMLEREARVMEMLAGQGR